MLWLFVILFLPVFACLAYVGDMQKLSLSLFILGFLGYWAMLS
jgi:hypothetical protein